jgi:hypothetical protein
MLAGSLLVYGVGVVWIEGGWEVYSCGKAYENDEEGVGLGKKHAGYECCGGSHP